MLDRKTWFNIKKFIYDLITWPDREIALNTQLKIWHCNDENTDLQRLYMNIGVNWWSKDDISWTGFHTRVFRSKRRIALWNTSESERVDNSSIACAYVYINVCARECASSIDRSARILPIVYNWRWRAPASLDKSQRVAVSIYWTGVLTLFGLIFHN